MSNQCKGCIYSFVTNCGTYCQYILITEHRRPCPPGKGCTVKKCRREQKMSRTYDFPIQKKRLIDVSTLKYRVALNDDGDMICYVLAADIDKAPAIDPEITRPVGKWVHESDDDQDEGEYSCSQCGYADYFPDGVPLSRYCQNCGARMED